MATKKPNPPDRSMDPMTAQLRRLELEHPDGQLRRRVLDDVDAVLRRPGTPRFGFQPVLAGALLTGCLWLLFLGARSPSDSREGIPTAYVETTADWLDLSPELAHHVVRPMSSSVKPQDVSTFEGRLHHATHTAIDL